MAESIIVHFAHADRVAIADLLLDLGCSAVGEDAWQYPGSIFCEPGPPRVAAETPTLLVFSYWDTLSEYEPSDLLALQVRLGKSPESAVVIELRRSCGGRAVDDAIALSSSLLRRAEGIVDDTYSELWTLEDIQCGAAKQDGRFLDCYRGAGKQGGATNEC